MACRECVSFEIRTWYERMRVETAGECDEMRKTTFNGENY